MTFFHPSSDLLPHPVPNKFVCDFDSWIWEIVNNVDHCASEIRRYNWAWTACWNVIQKLWSLLVQSCIGNLQASEGCLVRLFVNTSSLGSSHCYVIYAQGNCIGCLYLCPCYTRKWQRDVFVVVLTIVFAMACTSGLWSM